jgi:hypothetical protein
MQLESRRTLELRARPRAFARKSLTASSICRVANTHDAYEFTREVLGSKDKSGENADDSQLGHTKTEERHLELGARAPPHGRSLACGRGSDELAVPSRAHRRLAERHRGCSGCAQLKRRGRGRHRYCEDDCGLAHSSCRIDRGNSSATRI